MREGESLEGVKRSSETLEKSRGARMVQGGGEGLYPGQLARDRNRERIIVFSLGYFLKGNTIHKPHTTKLKHHDKSQ